MSEGGRKKGYVNDVTFYMKNKEIFTAQFKDVEANMMSDIIEKGIKSGSQSLAIISDGPESPTEIVLVCSEISHFKCKYTYNLDVLKDLGTDTL